MGPVFKRVVLRPEHALYVRLELVSALDEVREIRVLEWVLESPLQRVLRLADVLLREQVSRSTRARVQNNPHNIVIVDGQFDEVVSSTERSELRRDLLWVELVRLHIWRVAYKTIQSLGVRERSSRTRAPVTSLWLTRRDRLRDSGVDLAQLLVDFVASEHGLLCDHSAADVDPNRSWDNRAFGSDNRPNGCTHS